MLAFDLKTNPIIVDYGCGNVLSLQHAIARAWGLNELPQTSYDRKQLLQASHVFLPGVGHFDYCMQEFVARELVETLSTLKKKGLPIFAICVGMQMLFSSSEEGQQKGLGWLAGTIQKLPQTKKHPVPHMGWNQLVCPTPNPMANFLAEKYFYFVHSFGLLNDTGGYSLAQCTYSTPIHAIVQSENVIGMQFHPEKSSIAGENFLAYLQKVY